MGQVQVRCSAFENFLSTAEKHRAHEPSSFRAKLEGGSQLLIWKYELGGMRLAPLIPQEVQHLSDQLCYLVLHLHTGKNTDHIPSSLQGFFTSALSSFGSNTVENPFYTTEFDLGSERVTTKIFLLSGNKSSSLEEALSFAEACRLRNVVQQPGGMLASVSGSQCIATSNASTPVLKATAPLRQFLGIRSKRLNNISEILGTIRRESKSTITKRSVEDNISSERDVKRGKLDFTGVPHLTGLESKARKMATFQNDCTKITESFYISGKSVAENLMTLRQKKITHVINCAADVVKSPFPDKFQYINLFLLDGPTEDILSVVYPVIEFIQKALTENKDAQFLVNCHQGVSRSSSITIAYLMYLHDKDYDPIYRFVRDRRRVCHPNVSFQCELLSWRSRCSGRYSGNSLYRVSYHARGKSDLVVCRRLVDAAVESLDPRGLFILQTRKAVFLWSGNDFDGNEDFSKYATKFIQQLQHTEHAPSKIVHCEADSSDFFSVLVGSPNAVSKNPNYDRDYISSTQSDTKTQTKTSPLPTKRMTNEMDNIEEEDEEDMSLVSFLYEYPEFESLSSFTTEDLFPEKVYALYVSTEDSTCLHVWIGEEFEIPSEFDSEDDFAEHVKLEFQKKVSISSQDNLTLIVELEDQETEAFFDGFKEG